MEELEVKLVEREQRHVPVHAIAAMVSSLIVMAALIVTQA